MLKIFKKIIYFFTLSFFISAHDVQDSLSTDLIISRYKESIEYLKESPFTTFRKIIIYNKGPKLTESEIPSNGIEINLANVGCEVHSYLYHILHHRDDLAQFNIFLPASFMLSPSKKLAAQDILEHYKNYKGLFKGIVYNSPILQSRKNFTLHNYYFSNSFNYNTSANIVTPSKIRPFKKWYQHHFPNNFYNTASFNGVFSVQKEYILKTNPLLVQELLDQVSVSIQSESLHYLERSWPALFFAQNSSLKMKIIPDLKSRQTPLIKDNKYHLIAFY